MKINCLGGGPGGLYFATLMKKSYPDAEISIYEQNRNDDTFGFGVVFSDKTMDGFRQADEPTWRAITGAFEHWEDIDIHVKGQVLKSTGHGFAGMHSASDTYRDEPAYLDMLGNEFLTHGAETTVEAAVENAAHPASAPLGSRYRVFDEIYRFVRTNRGEVTMLLSLDRYPLDGLAGAGDPADLPLAWARAHGRGRVFYTALGHRDDVWESALYQQHVLGGIRSVLSR